jgi:hypothetical protein
MTLIRCHKELNGIPSLTAGSRAGLAKGEDVVQCRTGHGHLGEYYSRFVPSESVDCPCGEPVQTREHIICECPKHEDHRHILRTASRVET